MLDQQSVTLVPVSGPVQVQRLLLSVAVSAGSRGLGLMDPLFWDQQPLGQEALPLEGLFRFLQGAVERQQLPHRSLPLTEDRTILTVKSSAVMSESKDEQQRGRKA